MVTNQNAKNKIEVVAVDVIENTDEKIISVDEQMIKFQRRHVDKLRITYKR